MRHLLWPFSLLFMLIIYLRNWFYNQRSAYLKQLPKPVICIGNVSTGGTGKTPWVQKMTHFFSEQNKDVAVLSRGYSGDFEGVLKVNQEMDPRKCGDEPLWLAKNTTADVYVGKKRFETGEKALTEKNYDLFILDDGFQHRKLKRDVDIVLLDASAPEYHYWPLPVGRLREPISSIRRAQIVVINKCNYAKSERIDWLKDQCEKYIGKDHLFFADFVFSHWDPIVDGLDWKAPASSVAVACGVGNPRAFLKTVSERGITPTKEFIFPDHYYWKPEDIERMAYSIKTESIRDLMITEKDAVKLHRYKKHFSEMKIQLWVCKMKVQLKDRESDFWKLLSL